MNLLKFNSVKLSLAMGFLFALTEVIAAYSLSYLVVPSSQVLMRNLCIVAGIFVVNIGFMYINLKCKSVAKYYITMHLNYYIDLGVIQSDFKQFKTKEAGEHSSLYMNDVERLVGLTFDKYHSMVINITVAIFTLIALYNIHYGMVIVAVVSSTIMIIAPMLFQSGLTKHISAVQSEKEYFLNKMTELLDGYQTFLENSAFSLFGRKSQQASRQYAKCQYKASQYANIMSAVLSMINGITTYGAIGLVALLVIRGHVMHGSLLAVIALLPRFGESVMLFMADRTFYKSGKDLYKSKFKSMIEEEESTKYQKLVCLTNQLNGNSEESGDGNKSNMVNDIQMIDVKDMIIEYENRNIKIDDILHFKRGKKYAIIGESGCGKSSVLKAILGLVSDYKGSVMINDQVKEPRDTLFDKIAYVDQQPYLFNDTIKNNIQMNKKLSHDSIKALLEQLKLDELDLNEEVKERGKNLSGGQRQRLALARALAQEKDIIFLDEAMANLDNNTRAYIEDWLLTTDKTVVFISHHLKKEVVSKLEEVYCLA